MNPQEKYLLGYITYTDVFYDQGGTLPDFNSTGTAYRIPIPTHINGQPNTTPDEFFVIANHQKISPYELRKNKGIYIYHIKSNTYRHNHMEMVTADGLWQWKVTKWVTRPAGYGSPADWALNSGFTTTPPDLFPAIGRSWVNRINGLNELQEVTVAKYPIDNNYYYWDRYLDENGNPNDGVIPENSKPWSMGYNQIFSPWSNPATYGQNKNTIDATMEMLSFNNGSYNLQFYIGLNSRLSASPSKPQNFAATFTGAHPVLTWDANIELDMASYKIYYMVEGETGWGQVGSVPHVQNVSSYSWTDLSVTHGTKWDSKNYIHYKVAAVDNTAKESVCSDESKVYGHATLMWKTTNGEGGQTEVKEYGLQQNYPNPFNPTTEINYQIPSKEFVTLKIYDVLGNEVATLVNEWQEVGTYRAQFTTSGKQLASGMYFYTLTAGKFTDTKKFILLK